MEKIEKLAQIQEIFLNSDPLPVKWDHEKIGTTPQPFGFAEVDYSNLENFQKLSCFAYRTCSHFISTPTGEIKATGHIWESGKTRVASCVTRNIY